ncbi:PVC-type heme-binding CxxCH protein [Planctomicrobium sp. SH668]|uniref:PVC-type heme-binding CxxCH protein n=1 Tax=Planctomicrobium sp. SH668 TaxID=3448126 RepID=UPI003F5BEB6B
MSRSPKIICYSVFTSTLFLFSPLFAQGINVPEGDPGRLPKDDSGRFLNLDFETGDLTDWTAEGEAWAKQPHRGEIDQNRKYGAGLKSDHTGDYWLGGYEFLEDVPTGTLKSASFLVDAPWCSFLIGGGSLPNTRVELVRDDTNEVILTARGSNREEMRPFVFHLNQQQGKKIFIRVVDGETGGWGHVNFDDFRFHDKRPKFENVVPTLSKTIAVEIYPHQNLDGNTAASVMQVPSGFQVQCAASEPEIRQPIAMAIDDKGRVWVAEAYAYPQRDDEGTAKDRILIFEDTDLDGILDKRTVFIEGLNLISGFEIGFGGVYVGAAPYLLFIPDRNQNDIPDGLEEGAEVVAVAPHLQFSKDIPNGVEVLLDGFGWQDTHETLNGFEWGPDGWLYGCHGVFTHSKAGPPGTPDENRIPLNAAVWRFHPVTKKFEIFAEGTSNPWGIDFNATGDAFITACVIPHLYYVIPNGRYQRQAGNHFNPHTYEDLQTVARHRHYTGNQWNQSDQHSSDKLGGGHAHAGAMIYQGGAWPEEFNGKLFMHNIHGNRVNIDQLIPEGSGYAGDRYPDFLLTGDKWSQMIDLQYGPDGQVWMIDWYDQEQCHRNEEAVHDRTNGRIYRVSYQNAKPVRVDMKSHSDQELIEHALTAPNEWYARHARRILHERAASGASIDWTFQPGSLGQEPKSALRKLWLANILGMIDKLSDQQIRGLLQSDHPHVVAWGIRLVGERSENHPISKTILETFGQLATTSPSPIVRLALASVCCELPFEDRWAILEKLVVHSEDASDHNIPLLLWYAMEPLASANPERALALGMTAGESFPALREKMIRRLGSEDSNSALALLIAGLKDATTDEVRLTFLKGIRGAMIGGGDVQLPESWGAIYDSLSTSDQTSRNFDVYLYALGIGSRVGDQAASNKLEAVIVDEAGPPKERQLALAFLIDNRSPKVPEIAARLLQGTTLRADAIRAAAVQEQAELAHSIVESYKSLNSQEKLSARNTLASRASYARILLKAIEGNRIPKADLSADLIRQLHFLNDSGVTEGLEKVWGTVREIDADTKSRMEQLTALILDPNGPEPQPELGRAVFVKTCQQCHTLFGTGAQIGPDITGSNRTNLEYILSNIVDPSAVMAKEYRPTIIATEDGRLLTGILKEENANTLQVQTTTELMTVPINSIEERRESEKSMMPDGLLNQLSPVEIRSLIAYLASPMQVPVQADSNTVANFFNGTDLTGWRTTREVDAPLWTVENGEIVGKSGGLKHNAFLVSEYSLSDFHFKCEVKLTPNEGNSGIQFRSQPLPDGEMRGYQADIGAGWWGKLYEESARGLLVNNDSDSIVRYGEWNVYEIVTVGSRTQLYLNGQKTAEVNDPQAARKGVIGLQIHSGGPMEIRFRNLELKLLEALPPHAAAGAPPQSWPVSVPVDGEIKWKKTVLDGVFRSEGCCIADFDNDGDLDIASGSVWYEHPDKGSDGVWKQHSILESPAEFDPKGYSNTFMNYADDLNGDGWLDLIVIGFPAQTTRWYANPGTRDGQVINKAWEEHLMIPVTSNESPRYLDITGSGERSLLSGIANKVMAISSRTSFPQGPWQMKAISPEGAPSADMFSHGLGIGDVNGDGLNDIVVTNGWWEQPSNAKNQALVWEFHDAPLGEPAAQMYVYDFDGDGDADVLSTSAHRSGIWWHEQIRHEDSESSWKTHVIDQTLSQTHAVEFADINGDGLPDFVTGRRWWAHGGNDPGEDQPPVVAWYEFEKTPQGPKWTRHLVDSDSGVGTQFEVADINGDGLLDIVTSNKRGTFLFEQVRE